MFEVGGFAALAGPPFSDVAELDTRAMANQISSAEPRAKARARNLAVMLRRFVDDPQIGDWVLTPTPGTEFVLLGQVAGPYQFRPELEQAPHSRAVAWHARLPRERIDSPQMRAMGAPMVFPQAPGPRRAPRSV